VTVLPAGTAARASAPASSANLGPGFDALALALDLIDVVTVTVTGRAGVTVDIAGEGRGQLPHDGGNLVAATTIGCLADRGVAVSGLDIRCQNAIPQARGFGSSAAAIVAGVVVARALAGEPEDRAAALDSAASIEGHPDNVAACIYGGLTIAWTQDGRARAARLEPSPDVGVWIFVPPGGVATSVARTALPGQVPHRDAAHTAGRAALLVHALTVEPALLFAATDDRLHQPYRAAAMPAGADLIASLRAAGVPAVLSGAGPAVLAFDTPDRPLTSAVGRFAPAGWIARGVGVHSVGVQVARKN